MMNPDDQLFDLASCAGLAVVGVTMAEPVDLRGFDRESVRLEYAARLRGDPAADIRELVAEREAERQRLVEHFGLATA
jgi:hypothetical protein